MYYPYYNQSPYYYYENTTINYDDQRFCAFPFLGLGLGVSFLGGLAAGALINRPYYGYPPPYPQYPPYPPYPPAYPPAPYGGGYPYPAPQTYPIPNTNFPSNITGNVNKTI